jgi:hypothetical protein
MAHKDDLITVQTTCPNCGKSNYIQVTYGKFQAWQHGEHIQYVWPEWTPEQRERLQSGICSDECWDKYLGV